MCDLFLTSRCARILYTKFFDLLSWLAAFDTFDFCLGVGCCWFVLFLAWMGCLLVLSGDGYIQGVIEVSFYFLATGLQVGQRVDQKKNWSQTNNAEPVTGQEDPSHNHSRPWVGFLAGQSHLIRRNPKSFFFGKNYRISIFIKKKFIISWLLTIFFIHGNLLCKIYFIHYNLRAIWSKLKSMYNNYFSHCPHPSFYPM